MSIDQYREPTTRAVALTANPSAHATDNGVLFTAVAYKLGLLDTSDYKNVTADYMVGLPFGDCLLRYPTLNPEYMSYDDHLAAICGSVGDATLICLYMKSFNYKLPNGNWLGRFPLFRGVVEGSPLAALSLVWNIFEPSGETSGKQLTWLALNRLRTYWYLRPFCNLWVYAMSKKYPGGLKEMLAIYYPAGHPIVDAAPADWNV